MEYASSSSFLFVYSFATVIEVEILFIKIVKSQLLKKLKFWSTLVVIKVHMLIWNFLSFYL